MLSLFFNNNPIPNFIKVRNIEENILSLEASKNKTELKEKKIIIEFYFKRKTLISLEQKYELVNWLKGDNFEESKLILPTRAERFYMAKCTNLSSINGSIRKGEGTIEFTIFSGEEIDTIQNVVYISNKNEITINYFGDIEVYPFITFKVKSACSKIKFAMNNEFIELNNSFNANNIITFNQDTFNIKLNNNTNMQILHLNSKRSKLKAGVNTYRLLEGNCEIELSWNNKYL